MTGVEREKGKFEGREAGGCQMAKALVRETLDLTLEQWDAIECLMQGTDAIKFALESNHLGCCVDAERQAH